MRTSIYILNCYFIVNICINTLSHIMAMQIMKLEAEQYWQNFSFRQSASRERTVLLREYDAMTIPFCLRRRTRVGVNNVSYTNDGLQNRVQISIDSRIVGHFVSHNATDRGLLWNRLASSRQIGKPMDLRSGPHKLQLRVLPASHYVDPEGIEIDAIFLAIEDSDISSHYLHCLNTMCSDSITYSDRHRDRDDIPSGKIVQMSRPSSCLEEDNIKIPIYHENVRQFRISALPPRYRTFWTFKDAQFDGCPPYSKYHWEYHKVSCANDTGNGSSKNSKLERLNVSGTSACRVVIKFNLQGISHGKTDAHIGSILEVSLSEDIEKKILINPVSGSMKGKSMMFKQMDSGLVSPEAPPTKWHFPDFTWTDTPFSSTQFLNEISMEIPGDIELEYVRLRRREESLPVMRDIYYGNHVKIQKVEFDYWWRDPAIVDGQESEMEVYIEGSDGDIYQGAADYIVFIENRAWAPDGDMDHTFVLYQDGSARILPIVPHGLETYIPFGNDIVIGQADPSHMRPHAPIKKIVIKPESHKMDVYYQNGGFAKLHIFAGIQETNVTVTNISFVNSQAEYPFAVFRSTWVEDGRAKVDHVSINGLPAQHVLLDGWRNLYGTNFMFFRRCISVYNSQSPDFSVEIMSDSEIDKT